MAVTVGENTAPQRLHIWGIIVLLPIFAWFLAYTTIPSWSSLYPPLDISTDSLRLLILQPGNDWDTIICSLEWTTFMANSIYSALSYTWGERGSTKLIVVNDAEVEVQENLWDALYHIRDLFIRRRYG
jgi:hypothetical protein